MKKSFFILATFHVLFLNAQANRFFYELTYRPQKSSGKTEKITAILDVTENKSIYRDYLTVSQDSILKINVEKMQKSGVFEDFSKTIKQPKFAYVVSKTYPDMKIKYAENILHDKVSYLEEIDFDWEVSPEKSKIGNYETQKATTHFGGRTWIAWFTTEIPFQEGPYKFHGLPGMILKIEDTADNFSWEMKGNKKIENYQEESYSDKLAQQYVQGRKELEVSKEKFETMYDAYKKDPLGGMRQMLSQIPADHKMPDGRLTLDVLREQEKQLKFFLNSNDNPIEISSNKKKSKR